MLQPCRLNLHLQLLCRRNERMSLLRLWKLQVQLDLPAVPAPIPEDSRSRGVVPASAAAIAALSAAGPEPTMTRFQDSMVLVVCESSLRHEDDARGFAPIIGPNLPRRGRFFAPRMQHLPFCGPCFQAELQTIVWWLLQLILWSLLPHFSG